MLDRVDILNDFENASSPADNFFSEMRDIVQEFRTYCDNDRQPQNHTTAVLAALIVASYVRRHDVSADLLPDLVSRLRQVLSNQWAALSLQSGFDKPARALEPAVPIEASVASEFIICLEDGRSCKSLKRYLRDHYNMTPESYRLRWGLPDNYPMVAPNFSRRRAEIAKKNRLGRYQRG